MRVVGWVVVRSVLTLMLLLWSLCPLARHAIDRTIGFWIAWALMEALLLVACIGSFVIA